MEETYLKEEAVTLDDQLETWRPVVGYEGRYEVSDTGRVRSLNYMRTGKTVVLKQSGKRNGYMKMALSDGKKSIHPMAHQLVAKAFLGSCKDGMEVNHRDGNKQNNNLSNLEYVTKSRNTIHAYEMGLMTGRKGEDNPQAILSSDEIRMMFQMEMDGMTQVEIAKQFNTRQPQVSHILNGKRWSHIHKELKGS
jgi:hypothetical protein